MQYKEGDIVVRIKESHAGMNPGDVDEVIGLRHQFPHFYLKKYDKNAAHDSINFRLATKEEVLQYKQRNELKEVLEEVKKEIYGKESD